MRTSHLLTLAVCLLFRASALDCVYSSSMQLQQCMQFCSKFYSKPPQQSWYNPQSNLCEPIRSCKNSSDYYDTNTNDCYLDDTMMNITASSTPSVSPRLVDYKPITGSKMICVMGVVRALTPYLIDCICRFLWMDSGLVDANGYVFRCDTVLTNDTWQDYFKPKLQFDNAGNITMYDLYTPGQLQTMITEESTVQQQNELQYIYNVTDYILFALHMKTPLQSTIRPWQWKYVVILLLSLYLLFVISYFQSESAQYVQKRQRVC